MWRRDVHSEIWRKPESEPDIVCIDGVYAPRPNGDPEFFALHAPDDADIPELVAKVASRVRALFGREAAEDAEDSDALAREDPGRAGLLIASITGRKATGPHAGKRTAREGDRVDGEHLRESVSSRCATADGFSLHANVAVPARDRDRLERLLRYCARPPLASERLRRLADGRIAYEFKQPWRDGTSRVVFEPVEFLERLAALVPSPRAHLTRYSGILGPAAKWRPAVVPRAAIVPAPAASHDSEAPVLAAPGSVRSNSPRRPRNYSWAQLMKRVFNQDVLACGRCGGRLKMIATIHPPENTVKILDCLDLPSRAPPIAPAIRELSSFDFDPA